MVVASQSTLVLKVSYKDCYVFFSDPDHAPSALAQRKASHSAGSQKSDKN